MGRLTRLQPFARNLSPRKPLWTFCATKISRSYFHNPMRWSAMNNLIKSILKTAVYFLDQTDRFAVDLRDRVSDTVDRAADRVSDRVSDLRDQAQELYEGEGHTMRNGLTFPAGGAVAWCARQVCGRGGEGGKRGWSGRKSVDGT